MIRKGGRLARDLTALQAAAHHFFAKLLWSTRSFLDGLPLRALGDAVSAARARLDYWASQPPDILEEARAALARATPVA